jgi:nitrite reductase/ring-hydroxylating ferredoxin subunit
MSETTRKASREEQGEQWREDFPVDWAADNYVTRREFTKFLVLTSGAICAGNGYLALKRVQSQAVKTEPLLVAATAELEIGGVKLFQFPTADDPAILVRLSEDRYAAYIQRCTHLSCPVTFDGERKTFECPCHNGSFDCETGRVLGGPPPRPLARIALRIEGGRIYAEGLEGVGA